MKISVPNLAVLGAAGVMVYATLGSIVTALMDINLGYLPVWNAGLALVHF